MLDKATVDAALRPVFDNLNEDRDITDIRWRSDRDSDTHLPIAFWHRDDTSVGFQVVDQDGALLLVGLPPRPGSPAGGPVPLLIDSTEEDSEAVAEHNLDVVREAICIARALVVSARVRDQVAPEAADRLRALDIEIAMTQAQQQRAAQQEDRARRRWNNLSRERRDVFEYAKAAHEVETGNLTTAALINGHLHPYREEANRRLAAIDERLVGFTIANGSSQFASSRYAHLDVRLDLDATWADRASLATVIGAAIEQFCFVGANADRQHAAQVRFFPFTTRDDETTRSLGSDLGEPVLHFRFADGTGGPLVAAPADAPPWLDPVLVLGGLIDDLNVRHANLAGAPA